MADSSDIHRLSMANEDYLEAIFRLEERDTGSVRSVDVAELLGVSKASVNKALAVLKEQGLAQQSRYGRVALTEAGRSYAELVWGCHRMLRTFLVEDLGVDPEVADHEACAMEHALSADTMRRWRDYLRHEGKNVDAQPE